MSEHHGKERHYFINGERETTRSDHLRASVMLEQAGFAPASYKLGREHPRQEFGDDEDVHIKDGERFRATHKAPTPVS